MPLALVCRAGLTIRQTRQSASGLPEKMGPTKVKTYEKGTYETQHIGKSLE